MRLNRYNKLFFAALFLLAIGFTSCKSTKNTAELHTDTENLYRYNGFKPDDTTTIAQLSVDTFFTDAKLLQLIHQGLDSNYNVKIALESILQANANMVISKAAKWPSLGVVLQDEFTGYSAGDQGTKVLGYSANELYLGFSASWEVDVWGKLNNAKKASIASWMNSYESLALIQTNLVANIAKGYYNLLSLDEQLRITNETIRLMEESQQTIEALKDAGMQNAAAVEQSNAQLFNTRRSVFDIETAIRQQENALSILTGAKPGSIDRSAFETLQPATELAYGVPAQLLANRPDVRSAELSFRQAYELTNVAQKNFYPSVVLSSAILGFNGTGFANLLNPESIVLNLVGSLTMPLYSQRKLKGNLAIAQSQQRSAALNFEQTLLTAGQEISDILYGYANALKKEEWRKKQIESLDKAVDYNQDLLKAGEANYIEVLTAQQSLLNAKLNNVSERYAQMNYGVDLYKALGGGR